MRWLMIALLIGLIVFLLAPAGFWQDDSEERAVRLVEKLGAM